MFDFGIKAVLCAALETYEHVSRASGRTGASLDRMRSGDVLVISADYGAPNERRLCEELHRRGVDAAVFRCKTLEDAAKARRFLKPGGKLVIDHDFVAQAYRAGFARVEAAMDVLNARPAPGATGDVKVHTVDRWPWPVFDSPPGRLTR